MLPDFQASKQSLWKSQKRNVPSAKEKSGHFPKIRTPIAPPMMKGIIMVKVWRNHPKGISHFTFIG
jgi:hypothetical protein